MPDLHVPPLPFDSARAARILGSACRSAVFAWTRISASLLEGVFGNSGFLGRLALREPETLARIFAAGTRSACLRRSIARAESVGVAGRGSGCHGGIARRQARSRARHRPGRYRRLLDSGAGDRRAHPIRRCLRCKARCAFCCARRRRQHGMARTGRRRAGSHRAVSPCWRWENTAPTNSIIPAISTWSFSTIRRFPFAKRGDARGAAVDIVRGLVKLLGRDHGGWLCLPHRSQASARRSAHPGGDLAGCGGSLLRKPWARIGSAPP